MNNQELENWRKVKTALAAAGKTSSPIYIRACEVLSRHAMANPKDEESRNKSF